MTPPDDHALAIARRVETTIAKIRYARDRDEVLDLQRRAAEDISGLHSALRRGRLSERVDDAADARLQEIDRDSLASAPAVPNHHFDAAGEAKCRKYPTSTRARTYARPTWRSRSW